MEVMAGEASQQRVGELTRLTQPRVLGDETSDTEVVLVLPNSDPLGVGKRKALNLHREVLSRHSDFFKGCFSERWNPEGKNSFELKVQNMMKRPWFRLDDTRHFIRYKRCLALMYSWDMWVVSKFTSVRDALDVLEVAAQLLCEDIIKGCLGYIGCRPWSSDEESTIRDELAALGLPLPNSLVARLDSACDGLELITNLFESCAQNADKKVLLLKSVCKLLEGQPLSSELVERVKTNLHGVWRKAYSSRRIGDTTELTSVLVDLNMFSGVAEAFVAASWLFDEVLYDLDGVTRFYKSLPGILRKMSEGGEVLDSCIRQSLLISLLPPLASPNLKVILKDSVQTNGITVAFGELLGTLSSKEQGAVFKVWITKGCPRIPNLQSMFVGYVSQNSG